MPISNNASASETSTQPEQQGAARAERPPKGWMAVRVVRHGSNRFAVEVQSDRGKVRLMNAPPKGGDYGRHGVLGALDDVGEMLKRFVLGEVRSGDIEVERKG